MDKKIIVAGISALAIALLAFSVIFNQKETLSGAVIEPPLKVEEISLFTADGGSFKLTEQNGKVVLLFFGYTNCPDVCPLTLANLKQVMAGLGSDADKVQVVFITTDPVRDTNERLQGYLSNFHPDFVGLTGSQLELQKTWSDYGVTVMDGGETHSARVYLVDQQGYLRATYPSDMESGTLEKDIRVVLREP